MGLKSTCTLKTSATEISAMTTVIIEMGLAKCNVKVAIFSAKVAKTGCDEGGCNFSGDAGI